MCFLPDWGSYENKIIHEAKLLCIWLKRFPFLHLLIHCPMDRSKQTMTVFYEHVLCVYPEADAAHLSLCHRTLLLSRNC